NRRGDLAVGGGQLGGELTKLPLEHRHFRGGTVDRLGHTSPGSLPVDGCLRRQAETGADNTGHGERRLANLFHLLAGRLALPGDLPTEIDGRRSGLLHSRNV